MNTVASASPNWQGVGSPEWTGLDNYRRLLDDETFWASFRHNAALIVAMAIVPDGARAAPRRGPVRLLGKKFGTGTVAALRACFYLPQVLPDRGRRGGLGLDPATRPTAR